MAAPIPVKSILLFANFFSYYETQQLILGTGTAIWWVTEPHYAIIIRVVAPVQPPNNLQAMNRIQNSLSFMLLTNGPNKL